MLKDSTAAIVGNLIEKHGFKLTNSDESGIRRVLRGFLAGGPHLTYYGPRRAYRRTNIGPTYADLLTATDENGENRSYMASEKNFMMLQEMESKNLIVPLVGDFAGDKALPRVARYLTEHDTKVTTFYACSATRAPHSPCNCWVRSGKY